MEARIARLEADVAHLRADIARMDRFDARVDKLNDGPERLARPSFRTPATDLFAFKVLAFVIYLACTAAMFGGLAHGFGWI